MYDNNDYEGYRKGKCSIVYYNNYPGHTVFTPDGTAFNIKYSKDYNWTITVTYENASVDFPF